MSHRRVSAISSPSSDATRLKLSALGRLDELEAGTLSTAGMLSPGTQSAGLSLSGSHFGANGLSKSGDFNKSGELSDSSLSSSNLSLTSNLRENKDFLLLLDMEKKGFVSDEDLFEAVYASGFIPTQVEIDAVLQSLRSTSKEETKRTIDGLFVKYNVNFDEVYTATMFFRKNGYCQRPDGFVFLRKFDYLLRRNMQLVFIPWLSWMFLPKQIFNYTPMEQKSFTLIKNIVGTLAIINLTVIYVVVLLYLAGVTGERVKRALKQRRASAASIKINVTGTFRRKALGTFRRKANRITHFHSLRSPKFIMAPCASRSVQNRSPSAKLEQVGSLYFSPGLRSP